jgi:hypothetical protein
MTDSRRPGLGPTFLAGGTLFLVAVPVLAFVPLAKCPRSTEWNFFGPFEIWDVKELSKPCRVCHDRHRVSLLDKWRHKSYEALR